MRKQNTQDLSRFLSYILRHKPSAIELSLDLNGWADIDELLEKARTRGTDINRNTLDEIVQNSDKKRFSISEDGKRIRAAQGHSIPINLDLEPVEPPIFLFHGTAEKSLKLILNQGILPQKRHHVHLSIDQKGALQVGKRHGDPIVLKVDAETMNADGFAFFQSDNGVWLTKYIPTKYISVISTDSEKSS